MRTKLKIYFCLLSVLVVFGLAACKKSDEGGKGAPTIERVRLISKLDTIQNVIHRITLDSNNIYNETRAVAFDSTIKAGRLGTQYAILGTNLKSTKSVSFNGTSVYFNPGLLTDQSIIVTIPQNVPYGAAQINKLKVVTQYGEVEFPFSINQPPPVITSFTPTAGKEGDIVTITGSSLDNATVVRFDDRPGQIQGTPTKTSIQVKVPAGVVKANLYVTTPGGTAKSTDSFGIPAPVYKALIYDDAFAPNWTFGGYSTTRDPANKEQVYRGTAAIKATADDAANIYGGFVVGYKDANGNGLNVNALGITSIKYFLYGASADNGKTVQLYINQNYNTAVQAKIVGGTYVEVTVPLSAFNNPTVITEIAIQNVSGSVPLTYYVDDFGLL
ncbi:IPT/TIG domain-containing protein [Mucilaginibacter sp. PAMB04168]|uniref:IPT/TIG domain-containing protein n=1 Tax=Mucilaginibacter sp. PAMB04168 TaxID=3138567 RepID=UPI0031F6D15B